MYVHTVTAVPVPELRPFASRGYLTVLPRRGIVPETSNQTAGGGPRIDIEGTTMEKPQTGTHGGRWPAEPAG